MTTSSDPLEQVQQAPTAPSAQVKQTKQVAKAAQEAAMSVEQYEGFKRARDKGRALRKVVPRTEQGVWDVRHDRQEAMNLLAEQEKSRLPILIPERHKRMAENPFAFYRGAAALMAADLAGMPSTHLMVQACGDAHIANFGGFQSPESHLIYDINDFDETAPAPWEWDVKRLAASIEVCGRVRGMDEKERQGAVNACAQEYRVAMREFAEMGSLDVWRSHIAIDEILEKELHGAKNFEKRRVGKQLEKAFGRTNAHAFSKLVKVVNGKVEMDYDPPFIVPIKDLFSADDVKAVKTALTQVIERYQDSLSDEYKHLFDRYTLLNGAFKVVGVGSVGTRCWIAVFTDNETGAPLVLQIKEAGESVLERYSKRSVYANHGERVIQGQRLIQTASDRFLGWTHGAIGSAPGHDYYVRQLWNWKMSVDFSKVNPDELLVLAHFAGWTLARAHARSGDRGAIAGYLGKNTVFDEAILAFAQAYADQNQIDYECFLNTLA